MYCQKITETRPKNCKKITETRPKKHFKNEQRSRDAAAKKRANTSGVGKIYNYNNTH